MENFITGIRVMNTSFAQRSKGFWGMRNMIYFFDMVSIVIYPTAMVTSTLWFWEYFFGEEDAKFFASLGLNCLRIPVRPF